MENDFVLGQFLWAGIDYLGETPGWPCKGWTAAPVNRCGFRKPRSYFHESVWSDRPMVHIAVCDEEASFPPEKPHWGWPKIVSHWNFSDTGKKKHRVVTYTNCEEVELRLNGASLGTQLLDDSDNLMMMWEFPYEPGTLHAVGKNSGKTVCDFTLTTAGEPSGIVLRPDRESMGAEREAVNIEVFVVDRDGVLCPHAENRVAVSVEGPGRLLCLDNGDMMSDQVCGGPEAPVRGGRALAVVQSTGTGETLRISATCPGLETGTCTIEVAR